MWATGEACEVADGRRDAGSTLLEMLVVVALLAMITGVVFANFRPARERMALEAARTALASTLGLARADALRTSHPEAVELSQDGLGYAFGGVRFGLPRGVRLDSDAPEILFSANGLSQGARLRLVQGERALGLVVEPGGGLVVISGRS